MSTRSETTTLPPAADALGASLHLLRLTGSLYCRADLTAPWAIDLPPLEDCMMFHVVTAGDCWLEVDGAAPRHLRQGSLALVPHGAGHCLRSGPGVAAARLFDIPVEQVSERYEVMRYGGGGDLTQTVCVVVRFEHAAAQQLVAQLPPVLLVDGWHDDDGWWQSALRFISRETRELRPGGETMVTRMADILVIQMIRSWIDSAPEPGRGWLAALRDPQLGRALAAIHRHPAAEWSLASLAAEAGMSRSAFAARFVEVVGEPAMRYLTRWRLRLARTHLREANEPLSRLAARVGYRSEAAFCRAFKREFGSPPGAMRRRDPSIDRDTQGA